jgi:CRP-like cAMP-binding protein
VFTGPGGLASPGQGATARALHVEGKNHLLELLPDDERLRLVAGMERFSAQRRQIVFERRKPIAYVHFPLSAVVSIVSIMENGAVAEVATVGNEGLIGLPLALRIQDDPHDAFYQIPGESLRMPAATFTVEIARDGAFTDIVHRYAQAFVSQIARSCACNLLHPVEQRLSRWILKCHDRVGGGAIELTQEFLSQMLGVRRPTVTLVAGTLQEAGLIRYHRGLIEVIDRPGLEHASCECYELVRSDYKLLLT